jgi:hypothetical protein
MAIPELAQFALVGGTNLSLRLGHRTSVDIDLFANTAFDVRAVTDTISTHFPAAIKMDEMKQSVWYSISNVKLDLILHAYAYLQPIDEVDGIRLVSVPDIIAMKLGAISGRGAKKDFWDIAALLKEYSLKEMLLFYRQKYVSDDIGFIVRSLTYFDDAEPQPDPISLADVTWEGVRNEISKAVKAYIANDIE